ncbi:NAD(P)-dependent oxidoreductase [Gammaproteobacteria bacterium]|nr:NAD(P)-dependent oxidoreductase [Gammaproteobacteria bacterium]
MMKLGFIGLGVMGFPMAGHLQSSIHDLIVFNRSEEKSIKWIESFGGKSLKNLEDVAEYSDVIILCIGKDDDVRNVIGGKEGLINKLKPGAIIVDHTTTSSDLPIEMNKLLNPLGVQFIDAPISGGQAGAESGQLSIMAGGDNEAFAQIEEVINTYAKFSKYMGASGTGQLTKMVNQICIAGLIQALAEGINFSENVGLNSKDVLEVISKGAAQSWQMENRWESMLQDEYDHGFAVDLMKKDLDIVIDKANDSDINLDITKLINNFYADIQNIGGGRWDTSSLLKRIQEITK